MRSYVMTTGAIFGLLVIAHVWRIFLESPGLARDPAYLVITFSAAALAGWAVVLLRRPSV